MANEKNLKKIQTTEEAREKGRNGGIKSGESRRKKKLLSQIYADIIAEQAGLEKGLKLKDVIEKVLKDGGSPAVSMLKEIREATEGSKVSIPQLENITIKINGK